MALNEKIKFVTKLSDLYPIIFITNFLFRL